jgi:hypothetical protein
MKPGINRHTISVINKVSTYEQRKKEAKKERVEPRITLRVISRLNPTN